MHVITEACCNDTTCVSVCPVNCIHPTPDEPGFATADMLYIDPGACIDCGACVDVCPVNAIVADYDLTSDSEAFVDINAAWYEADEHRRYPKQPAGSRKVTTDWPMDQPLRVAVVGAGPAGAQVVQALLDEPDLAVCVSVFERLPVPGGLIRYGVAPDHQQTKAVGNRMALTWGRPEVTMYLNVEIGATLSHDDLAATHHAVVYTTGAPDVSLLGLPGETLQGSYSAAEFVAWYNGHPHYADRVFDLSARRAVIIGNGNVAIDVARILTADVSALRRTDIAGHALDQLAASSVEEVVVLGRRSPLQSAFTIPALMNLAAAPGLALSVRDGDLASSEIATAVGLQDDSLHMQQVKVDILRRVADGNRKAAPRRIEFRFLTSPVAITGTGGRVSGLRTCRNEPVVENGTLTTRSLHTEEVLDCGMVVQSIGYRGREVAGVPFDSVQHRIPHEAGRVLGPTDEAIPLTGVYTAGWAKRGASGVIGTNRVCARETVASMLDDYRRGHLHTPALNADLRQMLDGVQVVDVNGWRYIDAHERSAGRDRSSPREKVCSTERMLELAAGPSLHTG